MHAYNYRCCMKRASFVSSYLVYASAAAAALAADCTLKHLHRNVLVYNAHIYTVHTYTVHIYTVHIHTVNMYSCLSRGTALCCRQGESPSICRETTRCYLEESFPRGNCES